MIGEAPMMLHGFKVIVQPDQPKMQLGDRVKEYLTPAQISDHNGWLLRFFGTTNLLRDGETWLAKRQRFVTMNPRTYEQFRRAAGVTVPSPEDSDGR